MSAICCGLIQNIDKMNIFEYNIKNNILLKGIISMKTVTMRVDDSIYQMIKRAADGERRNISNFIEYATLQYLTSSQYVSDNEMNEILNDKELVKNLEIGLQEAKNGDYNIV